MRQLEIKVLDKRNIVVFDGIHIYHLACSCYVDNTTGMTHLKIIVRDVK